MAMLSLQASHYLSGDVGSFVHDKQVLCSVHAIVHAVKSRCVWSKLGTAAVGRGRVIAAVSCGHHTALTILQQFSHTRHNCSLFCLKMKNKHKDWSPTKISLKLTVQLITYVRKRHTDTAGKHSRSSYLCWGDHTMDASTDNDILLHGNICQPRVDTVGIHLLAARSL